MENNNYQSTHHLHIPKWADAEKIIKETTKVDKELRRVKRMDDDEMREIENWQQFVGYNFLK